MTDFESVKALFHKLGIEYELDIKYVGEEEKTFIRLPESDGYSGFYCEFFFDEKGKFISYGVWE